MKQNPRLLPFQLLLLRQILSLELLSRRQILSLELLSLRQILSLELFKQRQKLTRQIFKLPGLFYSSWSSPLLVSKFGFVEHFTLSGEINSTDWFPFIQTAWNIHPPIIQTAPNIIAPFILGARNIIAPNIITAPIIISWIINTFVSTISSSVIIRFGCERCQPNP